MENPGFQEVENKVNFYFKQTKQEYTFLRYHSIFSIFRTNRALLKYDGETNSTEKLAFYKCNTILLLFLEYFSLQHLIST